MIGRDKVCRHVVAVLVFAEVAGGGCAASPSGTATRSPTRPTASDDDASDPDLVGDANAVGNDAQVESSLQRTFPSHMSARPPEGALTMPEPTRRYPRLSEALAAFRRRDVPGLRRWESRTDAYPEERAYGAYLRSVLHDASAEALFIEQYPSDFVGLRHLGDVIVALSNDCRGAECFNAVLMLGCGAFRGWTGARDKLLSVYPFTDAGHRLNAELGVVHAFVVAPDEMITLGLSKSFGTGSLGPVGIGDVIAEAIDDMSVPSSGARLLDELRPRHYADERAEYARRQIIEILEHTKPASRLITPCDAIRGGN